MVEETEKKQAPENSSNWADKIEISEANSSLSDSLADGKILNHGKEKRGEDTCTRRY